MRMKKTGSKAVLLAALLVFVLGLAATAAATEAGTFDKALARAKAENKPVVIDFYTDW